MRPRHHVLVFALVGLFVTPALLAQDDPPEVPLLDPEIKQRMLEVVAGSADARDAEEELYRATTIAHGTPEPLLRALIEEMRAEGLSVARKHQLIRLRVRSLRRYGELREALAILGRMDDDQRTPRDVLSRAEIHDALGENESAVAAYDELLSMELEDEVRSRILLRKALMTEKKGSGPSALAEFASNPKLSAEVRNRAAVILALRDEQKAAVEIYEVSGEGTKRFAKLIRMAEWALEANLDDQAQQLSWEAVRVAKMRRDRRYALTMLVEAYRRADQLELLLQRFARTEVLDDESRAQWIDVLRETGKVEDALALFRDSARSDAFSVEMRRELLELCRETGDDSIVTDAYARLIEEQPRFLEWREGLARFHLERGDRESAEKIWRPYLEVTQEPRYVMAAATSLMKLGMDDLAIEFAEFGKTLDAVRHEAHLFLFELHLERGRMDEAGAALAALDEVASPKASVRMDLSDAWARLGDKKKAVEVLAGVLDARNDLSGGDAEMRLALLLSEIGEEERALDRWTSLWRRVNSIPRRRYVEERMMTVAARLGRLAKIAVELETRLLDGKADELDSSLLVRLYTRVKDPVSASEIIEEFMKRTGGDPVEVLKEKGRVYLSCLDYYNYEDTIRKLVDADPDNASDHLRQLAMSKLERGQRLEARKILERLKGVEGDTASDEFEAGVLALAGMREEALRAYRRSLARNPGRIDTYLLLSNVQKELGRHDRSAAMFQFLAETADRDDLFTIAIDGILNMRDGRGNRGAPNRLVEWARRVTLERVARRPNKLYLFQLVADLSDELNDRKTAIRALKTALPIAGEQRTPLLRELMALAKRNRGGADLRMFGRRLLGQGEVVPPSVYLELGESFLSARQPQNATKTFNMAATLPEFAEMQPKVAESFEKAGYPQEALAVYERLLSVETGNVVLVKKVATLQEQLGRLDVARDLYLRGIELLLDRRLLTRTASGERTDERPFYFRNRNVDDFSKNYQTLLLGLLATLPDGEPLQEVLDAQTEALAADLATLEALEESPATLEAAPRVRDRAAFLRRLAIAYRKVRFGDELDQKLLLRFPKDEKLLGTLVRHRLGWGQLESARRLIAKSGRPPEKTERLRFLVGGTSVEQTRGLIPVAEAGGLVMPLIARDQKAEVRRLLERLDLTIGSKADLEVIPTLISASLYAKDSGLTLGLFRHWLNTLVRHGGNALYRPLETILKQGGAALDGQEFRSLVEHLVQLMVDNPDKGQTIVTRLPDLQKAVGSNLLTPDQVDKLIQSRLEKNEMAIYGIPQLFALIPAAERAASVRAAFPKIAKTMRSSFLLQLLPSLEEKVDEGFAKFYVESFEKGLADVDKDYLIQSHVNSLGSVKGPNLDLSLAMLEVLVAKKTGKPQYVMEYALALYGAGRVEDALKKLEPVLEGVMAARSTDYYVTNAMRRVFQTFGKSHRQRLLAVLDRIEEKQGATVELTNRRLQLIQEHDGPSAHLAALAAAIEKHPKDAGFLNRYYNALRNRGERMAAIEVQKKLVELNPGNTRYRSNLARSWRNLKHPLNAKEALKPDEPPKKPAAKPEKDDPDEEKKPPYPAPSIRLVKKAVDEKDFDEARVEWHRLWRNLRGTRFLGGSSMVRIVSSSGVIIQQARGGRVSRMTWPEAPKKAPRKVVARPDRGGLPNLDDPAPRKTPEPATAEKPAERTEPRSAYEVLVEFPFGRDEIAAQLRTLSGTTLDSQQTGEILQTLNERELRTVGREALEGRLLDAIEKGTAGKLEYARLFALLETTPDQVSERAAKVLDDLLGSLNPKDSGQVRRLARLYAARGITDRAASLYLWCATMDTSGRPFVGFSRRSPLLDEVMQRLDGEARERCVEAILRQSEPRGARAYGRDQWEASALETWERLVGPKEALVRCADILNGLKDASMRPKRNAAAVAARFLARAGRHEEAIAALEIALCKLTPPPDVEGFYRDSFLRFGTLNRPRQRQLFPQHAEGWKDYAGWLRAVGTALDGWLAEERVPPTQMFEILSRIAVRLHEAGDDEAARRIVGRLGKLLDETGERILWLVDLYRMMGDDDVAHVIELQLLRERKLNVERVAEVVARVAEQRGIGAAFALAEESAEWTLHPELLKLLIEYAAVLAESERKAHWVKIRDEAWPKRNAKGDVGATGEVILDSQEMGARIIRGITIQPSTGGATIRLSPATPARPATGTAAGSAASGATVAPAKPKAAPAKPKATPAKPKPGRKTPGKKATPAKPAGSGSTGGTPDEPTVRVAGSRSSAGVSA